MRGFRTNETGHVALSGLNHNTLGQHHMAPLSSQGAESDKSFVCDELNDEADFVHVPGNHDPGRFSLTVSSDIKRSPFSELEL